MVKTFVDVIITWQFLLVFMIIFIVTILTIIISLYKEHSKLKKKNFLKIKPDIKLNSIPMEYKDLEPDEIKQKQENKIKNNNQEGKIYVPAATYDILRKENRIHPPDT